MVDTEAVTLVDLLRRNARRLPHERAYVYLADGERDERAITWAALHDRALRIAGRLLERGLRGERALLVYPAGLDYLETFYGCLVAGVVAVPAELPGARRLARSLPRLRALLEDSGSAAVLTTSGAAEGLRELATGRVELICSDQLDGPTDGPTPEITPSDLAFLQYTSGSTAYPRGVMLSHRSLMADLDLLSRPMQMRDGGVFSVYWVPLYHDMGLVGHVLFGLWLGRTGVFLSPDAFIQRPMRWIEAMSRYRARFCSCPNFAYEWCARVATPDEVAALDLSDWDLAVSAAEPIRASTIERFVHTFGPAGLRRDAIVNGYGLAEVGVFVSASRPDARPCIVGFDTSALERGEAVKAPGGRRLVGVGSSWGEQDLRIVDPETCREVAPGRVGEIWLRGPHVADGYWDKPEQTARTFGGRLLGDDGPLAGGEPTYLRTGDLGFLDGDELFFVGRRKDSLVLRGRTVAPHDVEDSMERHPAVRTGCCAAFCVDLGDREEVVLAAEIRRNLEPGLDAGEVCAALREAVVEDHALPVHAVVLLRAGQLPRTANGKTRRLACRTLFEVEGWKELGRRVSERGAAPPDPPGRAREQALSLEPEARRDWIAATLLDEVARLSGLGRGELEPDVPLTRYGVDSLGAVWLLHRVEHLFGVEVPTAELLPRPTVDRLCEGVLERLDGPVRADGPRTTGGEEFEEGVV